MFPGLELKLERKKYVNSVSDTLTDENVYELELYRTLYDKEGLDFNVQCDDKPDGSTKATEALHVRNSLNFLDTL